MARSFLFYRGPSHPKQGGLRFFYFVWGCGNHFVVQFTSKVCPVPIYGVSRDLGATSFFFLLLLLRVPRRQPRVYSTPTLCNSVFTMFLPFFLKVSRLGVLSATIALSRVRLRFVRGVLFFARGEVHFSGRSPRDLSVAKTKDVGNSRRLLRAIRFLVFRQLSRQGVSVVLRPMVVGGVVGTFHVRLRLFPRREGLARGLFMVMPSKSCHSYLFLLIPFLTSPPFPIVLAIYNDVKGGLIPFFLYSFSFFSYTNIPRNIIVGVGNFLRFFRIGQGGLFLRLPTSLFYKVQPISRGVGGLFASFFHVTTYLRGQSLFPKGSLFRHGVANRIPWTSILLVLPGGIRVRAIRRRVRVASSRYLQLFCVGLRGVFQKGGGGDSVYSGNSNLL